MPRRASQLRKAVALEAILKNASTRRIRPGVRRLSKRLSSGCEIRHIAVFWLTFAFFSRTERTYVSQLQELIDIYVKPAAEPATGTFGTQSSKETVIPASERRIVFNGLESLYQFHKDAFLPALERAIAPLKESTEDPTGDVSSSVASQIAMVFVSQAAFMRLYQTYIK